MGAGAQLLGVAVEPDGSVVAAGQAGGRAVVDRFSPAGQLEGSWAGPGGYARGIAVEANGDVVVSGQGNGALFVARLSAVARPGRELRLRGHCHCAAGRSGIRRRARAGRERCRRGIGRRIRRRAVQRLRRGGMGQRVQLRRLFVCPGRGGAIRRQDRRRRPAAAGAHASGHQRRDRPAESGRGSRLRLRLWRGYDLLLPEHRLHVVQRGGGADRRPNRCRRGQRRRPDSHLRPLRRERVARWELRVWRFRGAPRGPEHHDAGRGARPLRDRDRRRRQDRLCRGIRQYRHGRRRG